MYKKIFILFFFLPAKYLHSPQSGFTFFWQTYNSRPDKAYPSLHPGVGKVDPTIFNQYLSNWYPSSFTTDVYNQSGQRILRNQSFATVEQYLMFHKILVHPAGGLTKAQTIFTNTEPWFSKLTARPFTDNNPVWHSQKQKYILDALRLKFNQNTNLKSLLLKSGDSVLAEASPFDVTWGIGMAETNPNVANMTQWAENLLGKSLSIVRKEFQPVGSTRTVSPPRRTASPQRITRNPSNPIQCFLDEELLVFRSNGDAFTKTPNSRIGFGKQTGPLNYILNMGMLHQYIENESDNPVWNSLAWEDITQIFNYWDEMLEPRAKTILKKYFIRLKELLLEYLVEYGRVQVVAKELSSDLKTKFVRETKEAFVNKRKDWTTRLEAELRNLLPRP